MCQIVCGGSWQQTQRNAGIRISKYVQAYRNSKLSVILRCCAEVYYAYESAKIMPQNVARTQIRSYDFELMDAVSLLSSSSNNNNNNDSINLSAAQLFVRARVCGIPFVFWMVVAIQRSTL